ncbi:MAG: hypothetical protein M5U26_07060 [Planctomycetota bacterium]|nr:hypothetical protein [Planctomycetota bacterium]
MAGQLPASNPDHEPLLAQLERFKRQVETEKKNFRRLDPADLDKLNQTAMNLARRDPGIEVGRKNPAEGVSISYAGTSLMLGLDRAEGRERLVLESGGQRFSVDEQVLSKRPGAAIRIVQRLGQAMQKAGVAPGPKWDAIHEAPFSCARRGEGEQIEIFYDGEVYKGKASGMEKTAEEAKRGLEQACAGLLNALRNDAAVADEVRATVGVLVEGAHKELKQNDYLPSEFCRRVLYDGYLENNVGGAAERYKTELEAYRKAYEAYTNLDSDFVGQDGAGNELASLFNHEGNVVWREYDKQADRTSFGIKHMSSEERALMYIVSEFAGKHDQAPADDPVRVRMTHPALGIVSSYDVKAGKFESDEPLWAQCAAMTTYAGLPDWMGEPHWAFPPHVVMIDAFSNPKAIVTPAGRVDLPHFSKIANVDERRKAQEAYLDKLAQVLNTTGLLHLYFVYFHQYVLDSPIETSRGLLGCSAHSGDIHQNVYESLDREMGGHYLGDCDDLAELYMNLTRRQGKLSFVMAVPGHATCGWVEKQPQGNGFRMQFLDTGPPRIVETETLDSVVEEGSRTYDRDKTMRFDPKSLSFLFRFAGEPTRTPYWLSTRMFVDKEYAEVMERVQSYWHFHFYALGVQTMEERIAKGDAVPENCTELAGLYGRVREFGKAVEWTQKALAQLKPDEVLTRINETARIAGDLHEAGEDEKAFEAIQKSTQELLSYTVPSQEWMRTISSRLSNAALMNSVGHPWEAYALLRQDAEVFFRSRRMRLDHAGTLTNIYDEMNKAVRKGKTLTEAESGQMRQLDALLSNFYRIMVFKKEDDFGDMQRNFAYIGLYYAAKYGHEKLREELLKDGPWPQGEPNLAARAQNLDEAEDWKWIRISLWSYLFEIGDALDPDKPESEWRKDDAIKLAEAMERAAVHARKRGSLASAEFSLLTTKLTHGFLTKNWDEVKEVLKQVKERDFARLTADVAEAFGRGARFVTPEEFETQYKLFAQHVSARPPFFNVVYEAYRSGCYEHARRAAKLALEHWKHDPLMNENGQREVKFLDKLIEARQKEKPAPGK